MRKYVFIITFMFPFFVSASNLYYMDKEGAFSKDEDIVSVLVSSGKQAEVSIHTESMSCHIRTSNVEEAYKIQDTLLKDKGSWVQCHGEHKKPNGPESVYLQTKEYSLGRKIAEPAKKMI